jgi:hypothetical protein
MTFTRSIALACLLTGAGFCQQDWTHYVRIGGHGQPSAARAAEILKGAADTYVAGIEVDNSITGHYESFLDPAQKLENLRAFVQKAHEAGQYAFVYTCGTESVTSDAANKPHTFLKDHPDWLQRKITGEPAVFGGGIAFWVRQGDEDVWLSPFAKDWMKVYLERIRQIAATGVDGVYIDIPYWMTHFKGWGDSWASFDDYTVAAFKQKTGLDAKKDLKLGDFRDANFRRWVDFRIEALTDFMRQVDVAAKSVNPKIKTIAEIYPGIEDPAVVVGTDVYEMYPVVDTIAHEYSVGGNATRRSPLAWFQNMVGMYSFRAFAAPKPSWMLTYSWDNDKNVTPQEPMKNLAMAQLMAGTNTWDARGHVMGNSNDLVTRTEIFKWIKEYEKVFFLPRDVIRPIGVYFSPKTRNYFMKEFIGSYRGVMIALMQSHLEFQVVTPRTLDSFKGDALILPDVRCLSAAELGMLKTYAASGKTLVVTGETGKYDDTGAEVKANPVHQLLGITDAAQKKVATSGRKLIYFPNNPGAEYSAALQEEFNQQAAAGTYEQAQFHALRKSFVEEVVRVSGHQPAVEVDASPFISSQVASVGGATRVYLANFKGLRANENAQQTPEKNVKVVFHSDRRGKAFVLPYLGSLQQLEGEWKDGALTCVIPEIGKGAVVWMEQFGFGEGDPLLP